MDTIIYIRFALLAYLVIINITAVIITVHDKRAAKKSKWRVPERTLLLIAALSGCIAMYFTMKVIRHKTKHPKFMIGIPLIFIAEAAAAYFLFPYYSFIFV